MKRQCVAGNGGGQQLGTWVLSSLQCVRRCTDVWFGCNPCIRHCFCPACIVLQTGGNASIPLPEDVPDAWKALPEYFAFDIIEFLVFVTRYSAIMLNVRCACVGKCLYTLAHNHAYCYTCMHASLAGLVFPQVDTASAHVYKRHPPPHEIHCRFPRFRIPHQDPL